MDTVQLEQLIEEKRQLYLEAKRHYDTLYTHEKLALQPEINKLLNDYIQLVAKQNELRKSLSK